MTRFSTLSKSALAALGLALATPALAGDVAINLTDIQAAKGDLYIALQTEEQFMKPAGSYGEIIKIPAAGDRIVTLKNVKAGDYAVQIWHDVNDDHQFNTDAKGRPLDGWAMVNAESLHTIPIFAQVKLSVPEKGTSLTLKMNYAK